MLFSALNKLFLFLVGSSTQSLAGNEEGISQCLSFPYVNTLQESYCETLTLSSFFLQRYVLINYCYHMNPFAVRCLQCSRKKYEILVPSRSK